MLRFSWLDESNIHNVAFLVNFFDSDGIFCFAVGKEHEFFLERLTTVKDGIESLLREFLPFENDF